MNTCRHSYSYYVAVEIKGGISMRFISCASYYGSGSSVVTDFVSEFNSVASFGDEEFRFVHDPDGIADLEYNLVENFNRHNSGHAVKRYQKLVDYYSGNILSKKCKGIFGESWEKCSKEYINQLTDFTYHGWWQYDLIDKGPVFLFRKRILNKLLHLTFWRNDPERTLNTMKKEITYCAHPTEDKFLRLTREYIENLFETVCEDKEIIMADQIVPSSNTEKYLRYFNDIKVVIVDRDPRDIFILEKYHWRDGIIPSNVEEFCKWFLYTRENGKHRQTQNDNIHFLQFEDMIYKYEQTTVELAAWAGLDLVDHTRKKVCFNPDKSIHNTRLWQKEKCNLYEIKYIEDHLKNYLYDLGESYE